MEEQVNNIILHLDTFVLVFLRITALIVSSPIFGRQNIPNMAKIGLCLAISYVVFTARPEISEVEITGIWQYALLCVKELMFGLVIGYCTQVFFSLVQTAGHAIDMQMGFGMVNVFDVQNNVSVPVTGNFLYMILTLMFFVVNAHQQLIHILISTFDYVPVGQVVLNPGVYAAALSVFVKAFVMAANVAMPFIAAGMLAEVTLGFIVRTTPQMNVFVVGMPLKVLLGFLMLLLILPTYVQYTGTIMNTMFAAMDTMLRGLAGTA